MIRPLERLVWRWRNGACSPNRIQRALHDEINRQVNERSGLEARRLELRRFAATALRQFDQGTESALRRLGERRFVEVLALLRKSNSALAELLSTDDAWRRLAEARQERVRLSERLGLERFKDLATLRVLDRLLSRATELLESGEPRKAVFIVRLLRQEIRELGACQSQEQKPGENLLAWLELAGASTTEPECLAGLRRLAGEGYLVLAGRLCDDLEIELTVNAQRIRAGSDDEIRDLERTCLRASGLEVQLKGWVSSDHDS